MPRRRSVVLVLLKPRSILAVTLAALLGSVALAFAAPQLLRPSTRLAGLAVGIDAGHGGIDSGASHADSPLMEKEITLDVAQRLSRLVAAEGGRAVLTRTGDWESDLPDRTELDRRAGIARAGGAQVFVSIHVDAYRDPSCCGSQVFYHPSATKAQILAEAIQAEFLKRQPDSFRRAAPERYYLLLCTRVPAVLVELGFISHPEERTRLNQASYREELAIAIRDGLIHYQEKERRARPPLPR